MCEKKRYHGNMVLWYHLLEAINRNHGSVFLPRFSACFQTRGGTACSLSFVSNVDCRFGMVVLSTRARLLAGGGGQDQRNGEHILLLCGHVSVQIPGITFVHIIIFYKNAVR